MIIVRVYQIGGSAVVGTDLRFLKKSEIWTSFPGRPPTGPKIRGSEGSCKAPLDVGSIFVSQKVWAVKVKSWNKVGK